MHMQYVLLFLVLIQTGFKFYAVTRSYSSHPFFALLVSRIEEMILSCCDVKCVHKSSIHDTCK